MRLAAARVFVDDLAVARTFYADGLGLPVRVEDDGYLVLDGGGVDVVVEPMPLDADDDDRALVGRFTGLSLEVPDVRGAHGTLTGRGVVFEGEPSAQAWGGVLATVVDPCGNRLQLVEYPRRDRDVPDA